MTLLYPWILILFPAYLLCQKLCKEPIKEIYFPNFAMLKSASNSGADIEKYLRHAIALLMILALSSPIQKLQYDKNIQNGYDISLLLDASDSMREGDRFESAKRIISDFVSSRDGDRLALGVFADYAYLSVPLTYHKEALTTVLSHLNIGVAGEHHTALYEALYLGSSIFEGSKAKDRIVILLTDGLNTVRSVPLNIALKRAKKYNLKIYTIGIGDDYRKAVLQKIANDSGGKFYAATDEKMLKSIYTQINKIEKSNFSTSKSIYNKPLFRYPLGLALLLFLGLFWLSYRPGRAFLGLFWLCFGMLVVAMYGPYLRGSHLDKEQSDQKIIVALDLSLSMSSHDILPSREEMAHNRIFNFISNSANAKIGIIGFASQSYLISPPTDNKQALVQMLNGIHAENIDKRGTNLLSAIKSTQILLEDEVSKNLVLFTDGGSLSDFRSEISYAKEHNIQVHIYNIGTHQGGIIKQDGKLLKDNLGNIVVTKLNPAIAKLAKSTGGTYVEYGIDTLDSIIQALEIKSINKSEQLHSSSRIELFYIPLVLALLLFASSHIRIWRRK